MLIAEIGCNHKGEIAIAEEMIMVAAQFCKVDAVKFQKRTVRSLLSPEEYTAPHPNPANSYGKSYGEHREALEFDLDSHRRLQNCCKRWGIAYGCSVWDVEAAQQIASLEPFSIKIPSACNCDRELLDWLYRHYPGEIQISLGMTTQAEEQAIVAQAEAVGRLSDVVLFACTSGYPVAFEDICLHEISRLKAAYGHGVKAIGLSGHHLGIAADIAGLALGATVFERHFTLDRTWKGTDHAASLEPDGMRRLARDLRHVAKSLKSKASELLPVEQEQRKKLKRKVKA
jgi:sialic acid synthase